MSATDIAEWMRNEYDNVHELVAVLRAKISIEPRAHQQEWIEEVRRRFEHLRAHFVKHVALEEHEGYLKSVTARRPTLSPQVDKLRSEHNQIVRMMNDIHASLGHTGPDDHLLIADCRHRIEMLLSHLSQHEDRENLLITYVLTQDIGTKD